MAESDSVVYTTTGPCFSTTSPSVGMDTPQQRYLLIGNRQLTERAMESTGLPGLLVVGLLMLKGQSVTLVTFTTHMVPILVILTMPQWR